MGLHPRLFAGASSPSLPLSTERECVAQVSATLACKKDSAKQTSIQVFFLSYALKMHFRNMFPTKTCKAVFKIVLISKNHK